MSGTTRWGTFAWTRVIAQWVHVPAPDGLGRLGFGRAENAATSASPRQSLTYDNIAAMKKQLSFDRLSLDFSRDFATLPIRSYYNTQHKMFWTCCGAGLARRENQAARGPAISACSPMSSCRLAAAGAPARVCWRQREMIQWFFRSLNIAELLDALDWRGPRARQGPAHSAQLDGGRPRRGPGCCALRSTSYTRPRCETELNFSPTNAADRCVAPNHGDRGRPSAAISAAAKESQLAESSPREKIVTAQEISGQTAEDRV